MELPSHYHPQTIEKKWQMYWQEHKIYAFDRKSKKKNFSIDTPPPTLSGQMHMGHAFSYSQGDYIARYHRMKGENVFYPFGTDDNGLPTERLVEKMNNVRLSRMERSAFIALCNKTLATIKPSFAQDWISLGMSADFASSYSTISPHSIATSQRSFIELYHQGKIYREEAPVTWCPTCQTAIAQAEFDNVEKSSFFNDIRFTVDHKDVTISTTRPELLPACVALMYHPDDARYKKFDGKFATVPLFNYEVPILSDKKVDPEKGTGILMVCTFGDKSDVEWWYTHKLPLRVIIARNGTLNETAGLYKGLSLLEARTKILDDLRAQRHLLQQRSITHPVNVHERCGTEIEFLKTGQWFIKVLDHKQELIDAADKIAWHPEHMKVRYVHWVQNLQWDWCISRQRFFGVPFPLWTCRRCSETILADTRDLPVDPLNDRPKKKCECGSSDFIPEQDVMDTWATSSLTPQIALQWITDEKAFLKRFPMSVRLQAHEIIRTWCFYTIVKSLYHHKTVPWTSIMMSGNVLDPHGEKMSKSKGNVVNPQAIFSSYGADAIRFWAAGSKLGDDFSYHDKDLKTAQRLLVKLWNASRFVLPHFVHYNSKRPKKLEVIDSWLLSKLYRLVQRCTEAFDQYEYSIARKETENFFWNTFCDHYLEIIKDRLYNDRSGETQSSAKYTLYHALLIQLKLFAPFLPHITEEIYSYLFNRHEKLKSIHLSSWPSVDHKYISNQMDNIGDAFVHIVNAVRKYKTDHSKPLNSEVILTIDKNTTTLLKDALPDLRAVCKSKQLNEGAFSVSFP